MRMHARGAIAALVLYAVGISVLAFRRPTPIATVSPQAASKQRADDPAKTGQDFTIDDSIKVSGRLIFFKNDLFFLVLSQVTQIGNFRLSFG